MSWQAGETAAFAVGIKIRTARGDGLPRGGNGIGDETGANGCGVHEMFLFLVERRVYESVWQLCCLREFLVISMIHLHSSEVVARCGLDFLCAGYFQRGLSRHMRVRFNAVVARANSAATFPSPRIRNLRIPRCSFKIPMTGSASAFRRRYNARPVIEANLLRMRRGAG